jgi:hypothetical protein
MAPYAIRIDFRQRKIEVADFFKRLPIHVGGYFVDEVSRRLSPGPVAAGPDL